MKDKKFLELLNLYLDGEIDPAGAVALEQEILANPARRRVYNDYCRIHRATKLVFEQFRTAGAAPEGVEPLPSLRPDISVARATGTMARDGRTGGRATPRPFRTAAFVTGLAAACAVGVFIGAQLLAPHPAGDRPATPTVAATPPAAATTVATTTPPAVTPANASFAAPVAPVFRVDPYIQLTQMRSDPFALNSGLIDDEELTPTLPTANASYTPMLKIDPQFRQAESQFGLWPAATETPGRNPFRGHTDDRSSDSTSATRSVAQ